MARTRNTVSQAGHNRSSDGKVDMSAPDAFAMKGSGKNTRSKTKTKPKPKNKIHDQDNNDEYFDVVESEEYDSEDYYPTEIAKKRETQKLDGGKKPVNKTSQEAQKQTNSKISHKTQRTTKHGKSSGATVPTSSDPFAAAVVKTPCVACTNAHTKCVKSDVPGQPCERCARMRIPCVVDPNYRRPGRGGASLGKMIEDKKTASGQESKEQDFGDDCSEGPLNSPAPTSRAISRRTNTITRASTPSSSRLSKPPRGNDYFLSSSPLSSAPETSDDELDTTMAAGTKKQQTKEKNVAMSSTPKSGKKARATRAAARKGPTKGISIPASNDDNNTSQGDNALSSSMMGLMPQPEPKFDDSSNLTDTKPVSVKSKGKGKGKGRGKAKEKRNSDAVVNNASNSDPASLHFDPPPLDTLSADQTIKQSTSTGPGTIQSTPTFLSQGHGSVLNPGMEDIGNHIVSKQQDQQQQQQQQQVSPLPPISHLGEGGAYIGRYDTNMPPPAWTRAQVPITAPYQVPPPLPTTSSSSSSSYHQTANLPTTIPNNHANLATPAYINISPLSSSPPHPSSTPAIGSPAYRYSAAKILFVLKYSQRAHLLAFGNTNFAADTVAQLTKEIEDARARGLKLWHEVHDDLTVNEEGYDVGGLRFWQEFGRN